MNEFVFTALGQQLVSRMIAGEATAAFTRVETSDHEYAKCEVETLTALTDVKQEVLISKVTRLDQTKVELLIALDNKSLSETYSVKAIGVYVKDSDQQEILFGVAVNTETPDPMPALTGQTISELTYHLVIAVAVSDQIEISVNPSAGATVEQLEELEGTVNEKVEQLSEKDQYLSEELEKIKEPEFTVADKRENIVSKESLSTMLGKIAKFFTDLKTVAFSGSYDDLSGKPVAATQTKDGFMSASDKKKLDGVATGANKTSVVNNNTTTQEGLALDARQANPNIEGTLAASVAQLNNDLPFANNNFHVYYAAEYGENWSHADQNPIVLLIHTATNQPWVAGSFIHKSTMVPEWNEVVLTFQPSPYNIMLQDCKPILAYGVGGIVYTGFLLSYNGSNGVYRILCYPSYTSMQQMTTQNEIIRINDY